MKNELYHQIFTKDKAYLTSDDILFMFQIITNYFDDVKQYVDDYGTCIFMLREPKIKSRKIDNNIIEVYCLIGFKDGWLSDVNIFVTYDNSLKKRHTFYQSGINGFEKHSWVESK